MTRYLAGVLTVIAAGVLLIAYGLLVPRNAWRPDVAPMTPYQAGYLSMPADAAGYAGYLPTGYAMPMAQAPATYAQRVAYARPVELDTRERRLSSGDNVSYEPARRRVSAVRVVERAPRRDWKRSALIVGGASATGAGIGAIFGGGKGALIGAAIAGGASTIFQAGR